MWERHDDRVSEVGSIRVNRHSFTLPGKTGCQPLKYVLIYLSTQLNLNNFLFS